MIVLPARTAGAVDLSPLGPQAGRLAGAAPLTAGQVWLALDEGRAWGYARIMPVPGLSALADLQLVVAPERRRQGIGTLLWQQVRQELRAQPPFKRVSAAVRRRQTPAAHFLTHHGFTLEHVEWELSRSLADELPEPVWPAGYQLARYRRGAATRHFVSLYDASFSATAWYQPFSEEEVAETLQDAGDLLFAVVGPQPGQEPVGVAWLRLEGSDGRIEPVGVAPAHQGRGVGRALLEAALQELRQRGAREARLGVWRRNRGAVSLYRQLGFRPRRRTYFLVYDLD
jgi:mycothiol synthase